MPNIFVGQILGFVFKRANAQMAHVICVPLNFRAF